MHESLTHPVFEKIAEVVDAKGLEAYVVGGYVRDLLLQRPSHDIDIVVVGSGIDLATEVAHHINPKINVSVFKNFGTAMFRFHDSEIEFVGARKESYHRESRKPIVEDGTLDDDQKRRDFTINALAISLSKANYGQLIDPFGGIDDLKNRLIRTPLEPGITYSDDPLRMIRAIRFATQLDFIITDESLNAISENAYRIEIVSKERIIDELNKILMSPRPSKGFKLLEQTGLLKLIFPTLSALKGIEIIDGMGHKDNFYHSIQVLDNVCRSSQDLWLRWAALLHDIGKPRTKKFIKGHGWSFHGHEFLGSKMIPDVFREMKLPLNEKMKYVQKLVLLHLRPINLVEEEVTDSAVRRLLFDAGNDIDDLMILCEADITSSNDAKVQRFLENFNIVRQKMHDVEERDAIRNWQPPISGEDIMRIFGITPSKEVGILKNAIKDAILDGIIANNFDEAYKFMIVEADKLGLKPME